MLQDRETVEKEFLGSQTPLKVVEWMVRFNVNEFVRYYANVKASIDDDEKLEPISHYANLRVIVFF